MIKTTQEITALRTEILTSWLFIVPIANFIYLYKYFMGVEFVSKGLHIINPRIFSFSY